jgi:hypothetical protein
METAGPITAGGQWNAAAGKVQMEIQQFVNGVGGMPVTLYDGAIASLPGACTVVAASSISLVGTMRALNLTNLGSGWVVSTPPSGGAHTRRVGTTAEAAECHLERTGKVVFYTGYAPVAGEQIAVSYRTVGRAVGRAVNTASQAALAAAGMPSEAAWIGSVTNPPARSSADCRNAALVMEQAAAGVSALWSGTYKGTRFSFRYRCVAGRCAAAECAFHQFERAGGGADRYRELSGKLSRPGGVCHRLRQRLGRRSGDQVARRCLWMRGFRRLLRRRCWPI